MMAKTMTLEQWAEFCGKVLYALPRDMDSATAQGWIDNPTALAEAIRSVLIPKVETQPEVPQLPEYPPVGQVFTMTLDGDAPENDPDQILRADGLTSLLSHSSNRKVKGVVTKNFKFVEIGHQLSFTAVCTELTKHGKIPEGQWREAVKKKFRTNGRPMGVADDSWVISNGHTNFPFVGDGGASRFHWTGHAFNGYWLWLVEVE